MKKVCRKQFFITGFAILIALFASSLAHAQSEASDILTDGSDYYGAQQQEAYFSVQSYTYFGKKNGTPTDETIANDVKTKVKYILGHMRRNEGNPAAIYPKYTVTTVKIESASDTLFKVTYRIDAKGVFKPGLSKYTFYVPISHSSIYNKSNGKCTSSDGPSVDESNFWYLWNPDQRRCPLEEGVDFIKYTSSLKYIANTKSTYPEYDRLFESGQLRITTFFGLYDYSKDNWNPKSSSDITAKDYKHQRDLLINTYKMTSRVWPEAEVRQIFNPQRSPLPYIEEFTKNTSKGLVTVRLFYGDTGIEHRADGFHIFLKEALANSQVIIYNGHSGIGKNLNLENIQAKRGFDLNLNSGYQIFYLGSCVPYSYYTDMFFQKKVTAADVEGTKNLDIIAFGNESEVGSWYDDRLLKALFEYTDKNIKQTYQTIIGTSTKNYFGVSGDEDNPTSP